MIDRKRQEVEELVSEWRSGYVGGEDNPAGAIELSEDDLEAVQGGFPWTTVIAISALFCCGDSLLNGTCAISTAGCCDR